MKNTFRFILMLMLPLAINAAPIPGQRVTGPIVPSDTADTYPTHYDTYGSGGYRSVADELAKEAIPSARRTAGMMVHVRSSGAIYILASNLTDWAATSISTNDVASQILDRARKVDTRSDIANLTPLADGEVVFVSRFSTNVAWTGPRGFRFETGSELPTLQGCVEDFGAGQWIADDCVKGTIRAEWIGAEVRFLSGYTNRLTMLALPNNLPQVQAAIDWKSQMGGGAIYFSAGDWGFGDTTSDTAARLYLKPKVALLGDGAPSGDFTYEGTYSNPASGLASHSVMFHSWGGLTNGYGAPMLSAIGSQYGTSNLLYTAYVDKAGNWVSYIQGDNLIKGIGFWHGWMWPWSSNSPPGAEIFINEVAGVRVEDCWFGPSAGPNVYVRGGFGFRSYRNQFNSALANALVIVDTSDTEIDGCSFAAPNGSSIVISDANTHTIRNSAIWNDRENLVKYVGNQTLVTNAGVVEGAARLRTGFSADPSTDTIGISNRIGSDTGLPIFVRGTSLPGGLDDETTYYVRWKERGGTNITLHITPGLALDPAGAKVDITSPGGDGTWYLDAPDAQIWAKGIEEVMIDSIRMDQSFGTLIDFDGVTRSMINGLWAWEIGLNSTPVRQSRLETPHNHDLIGIRIRNSSDITISGSTLIGSKGNTSLTTPWVHNPIGISIEKSAVINVASTLFDRLTTAIKADAESSFIGGGGNTFGPWVSKQLDSPGGMGVIPDAPGINLNTNAQIVGVIPASATNIAGEWSVAIKATAPDLSTNGYPNGRHSALFNLTSSTNLTGYGSLVPWSISWSFYRSPVDNSLAVVGVHGGPAFDPTQPLLSDRRFGTVISQFTNMTIEIVIQRRLFEDVLWQQVYIEGQLRANYPLSDAISTNAFWAPYLVVGQIADSGQFSHPQAPIYGIAYHNGRAFTKDEINKGEPWGNKGGIPPTVFWDFRAASKETGIPDVAGSGVTGQIQQAGVVAPTFGAFKDLIIRPASGNISIVRNGPADYTIDAIGGGGATNGTPVSVKGTFPAIINLADGSKIAVTQVGSNVTYSIVTDSIAISDLNSATTAALRDRTTHTGITPVTGGGTGGTNAATARTGIGAQSQAAILDSLAALTGTGIVVKTSASGFVERTLTAGSTNLTVANGNGASGNPTVDIVTSNLFKAVLNSGVPNSASAFVDWSQLKNVPAGFADGSDDGSSSLYPTNGASPGWFLVLQPDMAPRFTNILEATALALSGDLVVGGNVVPSNPIALIYLAPEVLSEDEAASLYQLIDPQLTDVATISPIPGDILYINASSNIVRLPKGTDGQVLKLTSGYPAWGTDNAGTNGGTTNFISAVSSDFDVVGETLSIKNTNLADLADGSLTPTRVGFQSGPVHGRASTFGDYIRSIHTNQPVSIPTEPRLLLLAPIGGQSLATGSGGVTNSFSTTPRHPGYSLSWTQGVHYGEPGTAGVVIASSALTAVKDLFAEVVTGPGRSETPVVAAVDYWNTYWSNNVAGNRARVLAVTHGLGGAELNAIDEGTASFSNLVAHIQGAAAIATASNWVLNVPIWYFVHGENDTYLDTPVENYRTNFIAMYDRMNAITKSASGQSNDPVVIMTQTASRTYENQSNSLPANAQLFLNLSTEGKIKVAVPTYIFPTVADGVHLTNIVSAWLGEYLSKAARHELFGLGWNPVMPTNVTVSGTNVVIRYNVPKPPLVFDTNLVSNPGSFGYSLDGATIGTPTVSGNVVTIPFTAGSPTRVKYGWNGTLGAADGPTTGQRGNLRDSDPEIGSLTGSNLYNWGLIFNLPTTAPSSPSGLTATAGNGKITLNWSRVADAAFYTLKRSLGSGGPYTTICVTNGTAFVDVDAAPLVTYYYVVSSRGPSGESSQSAEVVGTTSGGSSTTRSWVPTDLGSRLAGWYRASSLAAGEGNPVDSWTDESGNGYHLTASSTVRPTQQTSGGRTVVRFDGSDDRLDQTSIGAKFNAIGEANFWTVGRPNTTNVTSGSRNLWYLSRATNGSTRLALLQGTVTPGRWRFGGSRVDGDSTDNDDSGTPIDTNSTVILHTKFDFSNGDKFLNTNGIVDTSDTSFASSGSTAAENLALFRLGASALAAGGTPTNWFYGDIEMQIVTTGVITTDEQQKLEGYIAHALGLTNLLASAHPYKTNAPTITIGSAGTGDVVGPSSSGDGDLAIMSGTTGKLLRAGGQFIVSQSNVTYAASLVVDLSIAPIQFLTATGDVSILHATNAATGRGTTLLIQASGANRTISLPSNLKRTKSSVVVTNGSILPINFYAHGADNTNVLATVGSEGF